MKKVGRYHRTDQIMLLNSSQWKMIAHHLILLCFLRKQLILLSTSIESSLVNRIAFSSHMPVFRKQQLKMARMIPIELLALHQYASLYLSYRALSWKLTLSTAGVQMELMNGRGSYQEPICLRG